MDKHSSKMGKWILVINITRTSNKKHFKEMNSYVGMTMVKKEQGQDDHFNQQSILFTLPAYISATDYQRTCVGW